MSEWQHRCPKGHTDWTSRSSGTGESAYYCRTCQRYGGDPHFDELVDMKNPAEYHVEDPEVEAV